MTTPTRTRRTLAVPALALGVGALAACSSSGGGGGGGTPSPSVTVTKTATQTPKPTASPTVASDMKGRGHDVGAIAKVSEQDGETVIELDRYSADGLSDSKLAANGVTIAPHRDRRYDNQSHKTYTAPLARDATAFTNTCTESGDAADDLGLRSTPSEAADFVEDVSSTTVVIVTYDSEGRVTRLDTDPKCSSTKPTPTTTPPATPTQ